MLGISNFNFVNAKGSVNKLLTYKVRGFTRGKGIYRYLPYTILKIVEAKVNRVEVK